MVDDGSSDEVEDDSFGWLWQGLNRGGLLLTGIAGCDWGLGSVALACCVCSGNDCVWHLKK